MSWFDTWVEKKLGGYKQPLNIINPDAREYLTQRKKVCVIGSGLAGLASAYQLSTRGFQVDLIEKDSFIGGKVGSWKYKNQFVEHGFHAFFRQYYNLREFLQEIDSYKHLRPISDYEIRLKNGERFSFDGIQTTPIKNILSLRHTGIYSLTQIILNPNYAKLIDLFKYHPIKTFKEYDSVSFDEFADRVGLNQNMKLMFNTFARAFFAEPEDISTAELIKGFHFYFLSNDLGLIYDVLDDDFEYTLLKPIRNILQKNNVSIRLNESVNTIDKDGDTFKINGSNYDYAIISTHSSATQAIMDNSPNVSPVKQPGKALASSGNYAVLRLWIDKIVGRNDPFFIFVDRYDLLDSITFYHSMEKSSAEFSNNMGVGIYELHAYSIPKHLNLTKNEVKDTLINEFHLYFPELKHAEIVDEYYQYRSDFTAFHTGNNAFRPSIITNEENLYFAGDWVKMDNPSMLMEAAYTSGCLAANEVLKKENIKQKQLYTVPRKGLLG